ncbi:cation transporter [Pseudomonas cichorii]|uniref:Cation transporter n=1 Tax=Pseudomonas lijiangensis TaxID=2995658 RepID=A0ABX8HTY1_9PSED|nr:MULTISPECIES: cation transporter [Pseudomonas syringae group]MBX8500857.1 cation transporter [Pseudomonas lijiangensis]MBX8505834.1 cation transporter [Pseudomonas lijiangensis]MBX8510522.1 cation transporter [Pseudomonas cichorii]MBX8520263.1 cation transporter [Pseudomonas cichorii]MBX8525525.1 cation transporter [Pseudomonas cichorii]
MQLLKVQGMTCGHCVRAVTQVIKNDDPAAEVQVDLASSQVRVQSSLSTERLIELIGEEGYQAQPAG